MDCIHCNRKTDRRKRRSFGVSSRIKQSYVICERCGRAQRLPATGIKNPLGTRLLEDFRRIIKSRSCRVLVWGATPTAEAATKRKQVREELEANGHDVFFSEDLAFPEAEGVPTNIQEAFSLHQFDLVVNIANSPGSSGEAHEYALGLREKLLLWLPNGARAGFIGTGLADQLRVLGYFPIFFAAGDLVSCVISLASSDWVDAILATSWALNDRAEALRAADPMRRL